MTEEPSRLLPLQGGRNFRDMGGYAAADGKRVKWRTLFRSGVLAKLTAKDYDYLGQFGIRSVVDLRSTVERENEPTIWRGGQPRMYSRDYVIDMSEVLPQLRGASDPTAVYDAIVEHYKSIPYDQAEGYRFLFQELADDQLPLAFHCSAGKDRAGTAAALILTALGVARADVLHDYSLSETFVDFEREMNGSHVGPGVRGMGVFASMTPAARAPFLRSNPDYLTSAFSEVERREGSVENFIRRELKVTDAQIANLRERLLA